MDSRDTHNSPLPLESSEDWECYNTSFRSIERSHSATSIMLMMAPTTVRLDQQKRVGLWSINGVDLAPESRTIALAHDLVDWITDMTVATIEEKAGITAAHR